MANNPKAAANLKPFKPGETGNPGGKPINARNQITAAFLKALAKDFDAHGEAAIVKAREEDPVGYMKVCAGLLPKEFVIERPLETLSDDELNALLHTVREAVGAAIGAGDGSTGKAKPKPAKGVSTLQ